MKYKSDGERKIYEWYIKQQCTSPAIHVEKDYNIKKQDIQKIVTLIF